MPSCAVSLHTGQLGRPVPGGIGRYVAGLLTSLPSCGVRVEAFGSTGAVRGARRSRLRDASWQWLRWPRLGHDGAGGVVHAPSLAVPPAGRRPLVVTIHDVAFVLRPEWSTPYGRRYHRRGLDLARAEAAAVIVPSRSTRDDLVTLGFAPERLHVVPYGVDVPTERAPEADGGSDGAPYLLVVGTLEPRKGFDVAVRVHARLRRRFPDLALVHVGNAGWGAVADLAGPGVRGVGPVDDARLDALYRGAAAVVVPSRHEGFGFPALEAMARGRPVVASATGSLPEVVGDAGLLVAVGDLDAWEAALVRVLGDPETARALGVAGWTRAREFDWAETARRHRDVYELAAAS